MSENLGGAILRIMGDQASKADVLDLLNALIEDADMRERCGSLSHLVQDAPVERRQQWCASVVSTMVNTFSPKEAPPSKDDRIDFTKFKATTPAFCIYCCPSQHGKWGAHVEGKWRKKGGAEWANISPYLFDLVAALEALWNVQGHLLKRS